MRRALSVLVGISILLTSLSLSRPLSSVAAMTNNNSCGNTSYPAPYTGGANVAKYFYLADGSTVTITTTGAVIKQSPCHTAYREGWVNTSDICSIQTGQDLNGRLSSGSSNPYSSSNFTGCSTPATKTSTSTSTGPTATANATATVNVTTPTVKAATTAVTQPAAATKTLPNTGAGNILMLSGATSAIGTLGHIYYSRRNRRH